MKKDSKKKYYWIAGIIVLLMFLFSTLLSTVIVLINFYIETHISENTSKMLDWSAIYIAEPLNIIAIVSIFIIIVLEFKKQYFSPKKFFIIIGVLVAILLITKEFKYFRCTNAFNPDRFKVCQGILGTFVDFQTDPLGSMFWNGLFFLIGWGLICAVILWILHSLDKYSKNNP